jgi:hypothetical protein
MRNTRLVLRSFGLPTMGMQCHAIRARHDEEAGEVLRVALDARGQDVRREDLGGVLAGDSGLVVPPVLHHHLHRAGRVVRGQHLQAGDSASQLAQIILALGQRHRVREHAAHIAQFHTARGDEVVSHAQHHFADDGEVVAHQEVVVLDDRASQGVLDGHHRAVGVSPHHRVEHVVEFALGQRLQSPPQEAAGRLLRECAAFALEGGANSSLSSL